MDVPINAAILSGDTNLGEDIDQRTNCGAGVLELVAALDLNLDTSPDLDQISGHAS